MKIGYLVKPNSKGQIVIPQEVREKLNINEESTLNLIMREQSLYLYPVNSVSTNTQNTDENSHYNAILQMTQGAWSDTEDWEEWDKKQDNKKSKEEKTVKELKKQW